MGPDPAWTGSVFEVQCSLHERSSGIATCAVKNLRMGTIWVENGIPGGIHVKRVQQHTVAEESGGGGITSWRASQDFTTRTGTSVEKIDNTNFARFMSSMRSLDPYKLPHDHHDLIAMVIPRATQRRHQTPQERLRLNRRLYLDCPNPAISRVPLKFLYLLAGFVLVASPDCESSKEAALGTGARRLVHRRPPGSNARTNGLRGENMWMVSLDLDTWGGEVRPLVAEKTDSGVSYSWLQKDLLSDGLSDNSGLPDRVFG